MQHRLRNLVFTLLGFSLGACSQTPGFHWVDFKREANTVSPINKILQAEDYTAVREIGIVGQSALVFTTARASGDSTPDGDRWTVYSVSTKEGSAQKLVSGFGLRIVTWLRFLPGNSGDLGVTYSDCYECEPSFLFTSFHCDPKVGWRARWSAQDSGDVPGILLAASGMGIPYDDETVEQGWAVNAPPTGLASIGTWYRSRDVKTGKLKENVVKEFLVDNDATDREIQLNGAAAVAWERSLCNPTYPVTYLTGGLDSEFCKLLLQKKQMHKPH